MKPILLIIIILLYNSLCSQNMSFKAANHWKLYEITGGNHFQYPIDTLNNFHYISLNDDTLHAYLAEVSKLPSNDPPRWMGSHIATYEIGGITHKIEISLYGGFFYDETSKKHYQLPDNKIDHWLSYIRQCFMTMQQ